MSSFINKKIQKVKPSETLAVKARATELKASGRTIIDLSTGEPDIDTPQHIKDAALEAMQKGKTKYTAVNGIPELRQAISEKLVKDNGVCCDPESVIVTNGGKHALYAAFDCILECGDEVIIPAPYWVSYVPMVEMAGGKPVVVQTDAKNGFRMTPDELKAAVTPRTKILVLNSPSNPAGIGYTASQLKALVNVIVDSEILVISDEVYEKVVFPHFKFASVAQACPEIQDRLLTINALSKTYSMTGWRVGYAAGPRDLIKAMGRHQSQSTSNVCSIAQAAGVAALKGSHDFLPPMVTAYERRIRLASEIIESTPGLSIIAKPDGAFYLFVSFDRERFASAKTPIVGSTALVQYLLEKGGVAAVQGEAFGDDSAFRISVAAADETVRQGALAISQVLREVA